MGKLAEAENFLDTPCPPPQNVLSPLPVQGFEVLGQQQPGIAYSTSMDWFWGRAQVFLFFDLLKKDEEVKRDTGWGEWMARGRKKNPTVQGTARNPEHPEAF